MKADICFVGHLRNLPNGERVISFQFQAPKQGNTMGDQIHIEMNEPHVKRLHAQLSEILDRGKARY